jgi:hypothetical protein
MAGRNYCDISTIVHKNIFSGAVQLLNVKINCNHEKGKKEKQPLNQ